MNVKKILLVEDNQSDIILTKRALDKSRIYNELVVVEDGAEALDYLYCRGNYADKDPDDLPSIILLDLKLPKVDGLTVLKTIRTEPSTRRLPVIVMTSSKEDQDIASSYDLGANSYIRKPVDFNKFAEAVNYLGLYWLLLNEAPPKVK
jgi:CheY-like chemotaxis protein